MERQPQTLWILSINQAFYCFALGCLFSLITLFLINQVKISTDSAYEIVGAFSSLLFTLPLAGGYIGEKLGYNKTILFGSCVSFLGIAILTFFDSKFIYLGIACFLTGSGFVIPNVSALVGLQYSGKNELRYSGYTFYYMIYNVGFLVSSLLSGFISTINYSLAFGISDIALVIAGVIFLVYINTTKLKDNKIVDQKSNFLSLVILVVSGILAIIVSLLLLTHIEVDHILLWVLTIAAVIGLLVMAKRQPTSIAGLKIVAFLILVIISIGFQALYLLEPSLLTVFISQNVDRTISNFNIPASSYYALDAFFVIVLGFFFSKLWKNLEYKKKTFSLPAKFASSLLIMGLGYLIFCVGILLANSMTHLINSIWIVLGYAFLATAELLIAPIGLAMVGILLPKGRDGLGMGIWQLFIGFSAIVSTYLANMAVTPQDGLPQATNPIFLEALLKSGCGALIAGIIALFLVPFIKKLCNQV